MKWRWWGTWGLYCHPRSKVKLTLARSTQGHFWGVGGSSHSYTNTHKYKADLLNSPGKGTASERASVTHASKNKLGSCENKAWEPWNLGLRGWALHSYAETRGCSWASTGGQGNAEWQEPRQRVEGRGHSHSSPSTAGQRTQCACSACCVSYYKHRPEGFMVSQRWIITEDCRKCHKQEKSAYYNIWIISKSAS